MGGKKLGLGVAGLALAASLLVSCGTPKVVVPRARPVGALAFDQDMALGLNGPIPTKVEPKPVCGSDTTTFGTELVDTPPNKAKVNFEWGFIGEDPAGEALNLSRIGSNNNAGNIAWAGIKEPKMMLASGTIRKVVLSTGDLTFNHPFGVDYTMNIKLDPAYSNLALLLGQPIPQSPLSTLHLEIQQGLLPHAGTGLQDFLPGYAPQEGDRLAAYGPWIIDCGHDNFQTELHELTFLAFGHTEGKATVVHTFYNPYRQAQYLSGDPTLVNKLLDYTRWSDPGVKPFPGYLVGELLRVGGVKEPHHDHIEAHQMLKANYESPAPWWVCAPGTGTKLNYSYAFTARQGVSITATPDEDLGCVRFAATLGPNYYPEVPTRKDCSDPWAELNAQLQAALGNPDIDVEKLIEAQVPKSFVASVKRDPSVDCYDPLVVTAPHVGASTRTIDTSILQLFPFYGEIKVSWAS